MSDKEETENLIASWVRKEFDRAWKAEIAAQAAARGEPRIDWNTVEICYGRQEDPTETPESLAHDRRANILHAIVKLLEQLGLDQRNVKWIMDAIQDTEWRNRKD